MAQQKTLNPAQQGIIDRLKQLRVETFGERGASEFARSLGITPASYRSYENHRVPGADVLAAAAKLSSADLIWLITGQKSDGSTVEGIPVDKQRLLEQIERLSSRTPSALRSVQAFLDLLEETVPGPGKRPSRPDGRRGWLPVLGRSAAGVVFFWKDVPNDSGKSPADRLSELIEAYLNAQMDGAWLASIEQTEGAGAEAEADDVSLIQVNVPSDAEVAEFLDCPAVKKRYADAFALRIDGDSMAPRLLHGDLVVVSPSEPAVDGKPAVVQFCAGRWG